MSTQGDYDDDEDDGELREEPLLIPPLNFAMVNSGIYRSGYPNKKVKLHLCSSPLLFSLPTFYHLLY